MQILASLDNRTRFGTRGNISLISTLFNIDSSSSSVQIFLLFCKYWIPLIIMFYKAMKSLLQNDHTNYTYFKQKISLFCGIAEFMDTLAQRATHTQT